MTQSTSTRNILDSMIVALAVFGIGTAIVLYAIWPPSTVRVTGNVMTGVAVGLMVGGRDGTTTKKPTSITFVSMTTGQTFIAKVSQLNGTYAVDLPNQQSYDVTVSWIEKSIEGIEESRTTHQKTLTVNVGTGAPTTITANFLP